MENQCRESVPSGDNFDEQLQQLAIEAKQHPPLTPQRQLALNKLVNKVLQSDHKLRLRRKGKKFSPFTFPLKPINQICDLDAQQLSCSLLVRELIANF